MTGQIESKVEGLQQQQQTILQDAELPPPPATMTVKSTESNLFNFKKKEGEKTSVIHIPLFRHLSNLFFSFVFRFLVVLPLHYPSYYRSQGTYDLFG